MLFPVSSPEGSFDFLFWLFWFFMLCCLVWCFPFAFPVSSPGLSFVLICWCMCVFPFPVLSPFFTSALLLASLPSPCIVCPCLLSLSAPFLVLMCFVISTNSDVSLPIGDINTTLKPSRSSVIWLLWTYEAPADLPNFPLWHPHGR